MEVTLRGEEPAWVAAEQADMQDDLPPEVRAAARERWLNHRKDKMAESDRRKIILTLEIEYDVMGPITNEAILEKALRFAPTRIDGQADLLRAEIVSALEERNHIVRSGGIRVSLPDQSEIERQIEAARKRMPHLSELVEAERPILDALEENEEEPDYGCA